MKSKDEKRPECKTRLAYVINWVYISGIQSGLLDSLSVELWNQQWMTTPRLVSPSSTSVVCDTKRDRVTLSNLQNGDREVLIAACDALGYEWKYQHEPKWVCTSAKSVLGFATLKG